MPYAPLPDDEAVEALLNRRGAPPDGLELLASFAEDVRFAVGGLRPTPSRELARVLATGFCTDEGEATAGSNVHGAAVQVAGPPTSRRERTMSTKRIRSRVGAKVAGLGMTAKVLLGVSVAAASVGGATIAGPGSGGPSDPGLTRGPRAAVVVDAGPQPGASAGVNQGAGTAGTGQASAPGPGPSGAGAQAKASVSTPTSNENPALPALPAQIGDGRFTMPACATDLLNRASSSPESLPPSFFSELNGCIQSILARVGPVAATGGSSDLSKCISSVMGMAGSARSSPGSMPAFDISSCLPFDLSKCMSAATNAASDPRAVASSCAPFDVSKCLTAVTNLATAVAADPTSVPRFDLSACIPSFGSFGFGSGFTSPSGSFSWSGPTSGSGSAGTGSGRPR